MLRRTVCIRVPVVLLRGLPETWQPARVASYVDRVVGAQLPAADGMSTGRIGPGSDVAAARGWGADGDGGGEESVDNEAYLPPEVTQRVHLDVNRETGELLASRCRVHFNQESNAEAFLRKLSPYNELVLATGGYDVPGCGWLGAGISAASQDVGAARQRPRAEWHASIDSGTEDADVRAIIELLHSMRDDQREEGGCSAGDVQPPAPGTSLLDMHIQAEQTRKAKEPKGPRRGEVVRTLTRALLRGGVDAGMERAMERLTIEDIAANPDFLWDVRKLYARRELVGNQQLRRGDTASFGNIPGPADVVFAKPGEALDYDNAFGDASNAGTVPEDDVAGAMGVDGDDGRNPGYVYDDEQSSPYAAWNQAPKSQRRRR